MKRSYSILYVLSLIILSCAPKKVEYDDHSKLENYIKTKTNLNVTDVKNNFLIVMLQNEDCICTEPDMVLSKRLLESEVYSSFKKILIVSKKNHKIFKKLSKKNLEDIIVIFNENNTMLKAGYIAMTDRIIIYEKGSSSYYADLHTKKPEIVNKELLK